MNSYLGNYSLPREIENAVVEHMGASVSKV